MTAAWSAPQARFDIWAAAAFAMGVLILLTHSQGWVMLLAGENIDPAASGLIRNMYLPAYGCAIMLLAFAPMDTVRAMLRQPFLVLLMLIAGASVLWSIAPDQTVRRIIALYATTLGGVVLAVRFRWNTLAEVLAVAFAILAVASLVTAVAVPSIGKMQALFPGAWRGLWPEKNNLGGAMVMAVWVFSAAAVMNPQRSRIWWPFAGLALGLILMSTSKTALVSFLLGGGAFAFVWIVRRGPASGVAATWAAILAALLLGGFLLLAADVFFELLGKDATLTGRTKIWGALMRQIEERPLTGFGYAAVWDDTGAWGPLAWIVKQAGFKASHAHNAWLEQWLGLGLAGLVAWGLFWVQTMAAGIAAVFRERGAYLAFPFLVVYSLTSLTESIAVSYNDMRWVIFVCFAVKLALRDPPDGLPRQP